MRGTIGWLAAPALALALAASGASATALLGEERHVAAFGALDERSGSDSDSEEALAPGFGSWNSGVVTAGVVVKPPGSHDPDSAVSASNQTTQIGLRGQHSIVAFGEGATTSAFDLHHADVGSLNTARAIGSSWFELVFEITVPVSYQFEYLLMSERIASSGLASGGAEAYFLLDSISHGTIFQDDATDVDLDGEATWSQMQTSGLLEPDIYTLRVGAEVEGPQVREPA